ncbi:MAG: hypothetical protein ACI843_000253 [Psychrobacter glaciei]|jgi:hypothetical protein
MLRSMNNLNDYEIVAKDGNVGHVKDFLFDDVSWVVRYFVVETGSWLSSRKVLISPIAVEEPNWAKKILPVLITKEQVRNSPHIDTDKPVSRQHEFDYFGYYGYPNYWGGSGLWGASMYPYNLHPGYTESNQDPSSMNNSAENNQAMDPNLRSCHAVIGYHIHALDGEIGHVSAIFVEENTWAIRYLVIDTSNWWGGHKVLISPEWVDEVSWLNATVSIDLDRQTIKDSPEYLSMKQLNRDFETGIYSHYGRPGYWVVDGD